MLNDEIDDLYKNLKLAPKLEELSFNELRVEYRRSLLQFLNKEKEFYKIREMYQDLMDNYTNLEKKNSELNWKINHYQNSSNNIKQLNETIETLLKEKEKIIEEGNAKYRILRDEKDNVIRKLEEQITRLKVSNDIMSINIESVNSLKVLRNTQEMLIKDLEEDLGKQKDIFQNDIKMNQFQHEIKCSDLKKKMMDKIEITKKNVEKLNFEYIDSSYKLLVLQNSQLLSEVEYLKKQIKEIETEKDKNDKIINNLKKDIKTHQEVENQLASKNKNCLDIIKNVCSYKEGKAKDSNVNNSHYNSSIENSTLSYNNFNSAKKGNYISLSKSQVLTKNLNTLNHSIYIEKKLSNLDEELSKKKKDYDILKMNFENLSDKYKEMESKLNNVVILLTEGLNRLPEKLAKNPFELNEMKNHKFQDLSNETKYGLLTYLMNDFLSLMDDNIFKFTNHYKSPDLSGFKKQKIITDTIKRIKSNSQLGVSRKMTLNSLHKLFRNETDKK